MKKPIGLKLDPEIIEMLKELATRQHRSIANMVETLIANEYSKNAATSHSKAD